MIARSCGAKSICIPMLEWLPLGGWTKEVDAFLCPTAHTHAQVVREHPARTRLFPWPVDTQRFSFRPRTTCRRFLFINGHGGHSRRKGGDVVREAVRISGQPPILVYDQTGAAWPRSCQVLGEAASAEQLYGEGDVLLLPARFNGIGLEQLEALACGFPVIATDFAPMNESPCLAKIACATREEAGRRPRRIELAEPDAASLAAQMNHWLGRDIRQASAEAREFAESRCWARARLAFDRIVREAIAS